MSWHAYKFRTVFVADVHMGQMNYLSGPRGRQKKCECQEVIPTSI